MAHDTLLTYPDFNEALRIHIDVNELQLGAVISQKNKPIFSFGLATEVTKLTHYGMVYFHPLA